MVRVAMVQAGHRRPSSVNIEDEEIINFAVEPVSRLIKNYPLLETARYRLGIITVPNKSFFIPLLLSSLYCYRHTLLNGLFRFNYPESLHRCSNAAGLFPS